MPFQYLIFLRHIKKFLYKIKGLKHLFSKHWDTYRKMFAGYMLRIKHFFFWFLVSYKLLSLFIPLLLFLFKKVIASMFAL